MPKIRIGVNFGKDIEMPSSHEECTTKVIELCQMLLEKKPIYIGDEPYIKYNLPEFLCVLNNTYTFNLETVYDRFTKEISNIRNERTKSQNPPNNSFSEK